MDLKNVLPSKLYEFVERAGISTPKQIMILSDWDIKKMTNLSSDDVELLKKIVAKHIMPDVISGEELCKENQVAVTTGCKGFDEMLRGGLKRGTLTEIYGESGTGKTLFTLQAAAHNWSSGTVFLCTEDMFPVKRFNQVKQSMIDYCPEKDYGQNTFIEHITEASALLSCVRVRLPRLLQKHNISLIVLDSVAGPFRSEYSNYVQRADDLRELAIELIKLARKYKLAVLCVNQVTSSFDGTEDVIPSLGLAWSNMVNTRLWIKKTENIIDALPSGSHCNLQKHNLNIRELRVMFSPSVPNSCVKFIISASGIHCL